MSYSRENELLEYVLKNMSMSTAHNDCITPVLKETVDYFTLESAFIYLKDHDKGSAYCLKSSAYSPEKTTLPVELALELDYNDDSGKFNNYFKNKIAAAFNADHIEAVPIIDTGKLIGFTCFTMAYSPADSPDFDIDLLKVIAVLVSDKVKENYLKLSRYKSRASLERAIDQAGIDIYVTDFYTNELLYINKSMAEKYGGAESMLGKVCYIALHEDKNCKCEHCLKDKLLDEYGNPTKFYSWDYQRPADGEWFRVYSTAFEWEEGVLAHSITSFNITETKQKELMITRMAHYDACTQVLNRRSFEKDFAEIISNPANKGYMLFMDLDNFKYINDAFGHDKGDGLLVQVAQYLDSFSADNIKLYRYGGDEFIFVITDLDYDDILGLTDTFINRFARPWVLGNLEYFCTVSIGVAAFPKDGATYDELLSAADMAMYTAKKSGKASVVFAKARSESSAQLEKEFALRRAVNDGFSEFVILHHPLVDVKSKGWVGTEILPRWVSPQFGTVYPGEFIPLCERMGLIRDFELWMIESVFRTVANDIDYKPEDFFMSFNVSAMEFQKSDFGECVIRLLDKYNLAHSRLMLEIASPAGRYGESIKPYIDELRQNGVKVALDGFGLGQSSLESIQNFNVDFIKIDKEFIIGFLNNDLKATIVKAIIMVAHAAGARVCAEGVESLNHFTQLEGINCDFAQGIYFQEPVDIMTFEQLLRKNYVNPPAEPQDEIIGLC